MKKCLICVLCLLAALFTGCSELPADRAQGSGGPAKSGSSETASPDGGKDIKTLAEGLKYGNLEAFEALWERAGTVSGAADFTGVWRRTGVHSSLNGEIRITKQDGEGFYVSAENYYFSHSGVLEGRCRFLGAEAAILAYEEENPQYVVFYRDGEDMCVKSSAEGGNLGLGANVSISGRYTTGEPQYTNEGATEEFFAPDELEAVRGLLSEDIYDGWFLWPMENGVVSAEECLLGDGTPGLLVSVYVPTMAGYGLEVLRAGKELYLRFQNEKIGFLSTDETAGGFPVLGASDSEPDGVRRLDWDRE